MDAVAPTPSIRPELRRGPWLAALVAVCAVALALYALAEPPRVLMRTQIAVFRHRLVQRDGKRLASSEQAMLRLAEDSAESHVDCSQDAQRDVTRINLQRYDLVMFYATCDSPIAPEDRDDLMGEWIPTAGHCFMGLHSATDTFKDDRPCWNMIGGTFNGHRWGENWPVTIVAHSPSHPVAARFGTRGELPGKIYQFRNWQPRKVQLLMSPGMERTRLKRPYHGPVAWAKGCGAGKVSDTSLGHREYTWENPQFLDSLVDELGWLAGKEDAIVPPNPEVSAKQWRFAEESTRAVGVEVKTTMRQEAKRDARHAAREAACRAGPRTLTTASPPTFK